LHLGGDTVFEALLALSISASAASLPGINLDFTVDPNGAWQLPATLPDAFVRAGVAPGWTLSAVDGQVLGTDARLAQQAALAGPARPVRLSFSTPEGETIVVVQRAPLVVVEQVGVLAWPAGFTQPASSWSGSSDAPRLSDSAGLTWQLNPTTGAQAKVEAQASVVTEVVPDVFWGLSDAQWVVVNDQGITTLDRTAAKTRLPNAARLRRFQAASGDHLAVPEPTGLGIWSVAWPSGTPDLPLCDRNVPETCLVAGRQIATSLIDRPGGREEAQRALAVACEAGTWRACLEVVALADPGMATRAQACAERSAGACHDVARQRLSLEKGKPSPLLVGVLEQACSVDASGSLGERLRRVEDVGEGCMMLSSAFDRLEIGDRALLSLDQACVLGRADACTEAGRRRADAFALKTVRECEADTLPLPTACVQLGLLLQAGPLTATSLDDFGAFLRACELGEEEGCVLLGDYVDRWGIDNPRVQKAEATLLGSCDAGEQRACVGGAHLLVRHEPRSPEYGRALSLFAAACASGMPTACIAGAEQRRIGAARKVEAPIPIDLWERSCALDSAPGCAGLGDRLSRSKGTWLDAYTAWSKACNTGEAGSCTDLGRFVTEKHDPAWPGEQPAADYLRRGCENGDAEGCFWQASADVPKKGDPPEPAYVLLQQSCEGQFGEGCNELARIHLDRDTSFDDEIAADHLQSACDFGTFEACKELGSMYQRGKGVTKDRTKARELAQRYSVNADRRILRLGARIGFPSVAGGEAELVVPIPVGPTIALTGAYSYLPGLGGVMLQIIGETYPSNPPDLTYVDAGLRLYPNNKGRGLYGMAAVHQLQATGGDLTDPLTRQGVSARIGMYSESKLLYTRVEMGIGQYGMIFLEDFDEDETGSFPLVQATLGLSVGLALF
jgi:uncharacterized protein